VSDRDARFRRLAPTGDLFAHFGVALEAPTDPSTPPAVRTTTGCAHCSWYVDVTEVACPICGQPRTPAVSP
jgi:hypothetical protein